MSDDDRTISASTERDSPHHIDSDCPDCGTELVLYDLLDPEQIDEDSILHPIDPDPDNVWYDEWVCIECQDGIHIDKPESWFRTLQSRARSMDVE